MLGAERVWVVGGGALGGETVVQRLEGVIASARGREGLGGTWHSACGQVGRPARRWCKVLRRRRRAGGSRTVAGDISGASMPPERGRTNSASEAFDERLNTVYVASSRLVHVPGILSRDYTAYSLLAKLTPKGEPDANRRMGRAVEKRFSEFEAFHEALTPALQEAVGVKRKKAEKLMAEARKAMKAVDTMQEHVGLLGTILEKANGGWFGKNSPEEVANRIKMLNSYLRGCVRFAEHERVHEALASFVLNASTEAEWTPDPNDPNQVIETIEEEADGRRKMIEDLYKSSSITAEERDVMLESLNKDTGFEVHTLMKQHAPPTDSRVAAAAAAGAKIAGDPTAKLKEVAAKTQSPVETPSKTSSSSSALSRPQRPAPTASSSGSDSDDDAEIVELELEAGESAVYSGALVVTLPATLSVPPRCLRVKAKLPAGGVKVVPVPHDALPGQILPVYPEQSSTPGGARAAVYQDEDELDRQRAEERRRIEDRSFNPDDLGLDDIMANALGARSSSPPRTHSTAVSTSASAAATAAATAPAGDASEDVPHVCGKQYKCVRRSLVRAGVGTDSAKVGTLEVGETVIAEEGRRLLATQAVRLRFARGWTSLISGTGEPILQEIAGGGLSADQEAHAARLTRLATQERTGLGMSGAAGLGEPMPSVAASFAPMEDAWNSPVGELGHGAVGGLSSGGWGADDDDDFGGGGSGLGFGGGNSGAPSLMSMMGSARAGGGGDDSDDDLDDIMARAGVGGF